MFQHRPGDKLGCTRPRDQDCADYRVGDAYFMIDGFKRRITCADAAVEHFVKLAETRKRAVDDSDFGTKANGHSRRVCADNTAADYADAACRNTRNAAHQYARTAFAAAHRFTGSFDSETPGDFAHRREQGQGAFIVSDGFIGNRSAATSDQALGLLGIGGKVEIGEKQLAGT